MTRGRRIRVAEDFYNLLGVARNASEAEIKTAYRKLLKQLGVHEELEALAPERLAVVDLVHDPAERGADVPHPPVAVPVEREEREQRRHARDGDLT